MKTLIVIPLQEELDPFLRGFKQRGFRTQETSVGRLPAIRLPDLEATVALGGLGKAQFALQTLHLLERGPAPDMVVCAGAGGGLADDLASGDVVVATAIVEHDFNNKFGTSVTPTFRSPPAAIAGLLQSAPRCNTFNVHFGTIASGDEDIVEAQRRRGLRESTQALAVAWEGAGGARACAFCGVPYVEVRGITDGANPQAGADFEANLALAMGNVCVLVTTWLLDELKRSPSKPQPTRQAG